MKKKKMIIILMLFMFIIAIYSTISFGANNTTNNTTLTNPLDDPGSFEPSSMTKAGKLKNMGNTIIGIVQFIGSFTSVIVLIVMGIKYMTGSIEEKAEYKKTMGPYVIGAILVFATTNLLGIVNSVTGGLF